MSKIKDFASFEINNEKTQLVQGKGFIRCGTPSPTNTSPDKGTTFNGDFNAPDVDTVYYCPATVVK